MEYLIVYDVATDSVDGRRRLRKIAKLCEAHGQRVQKSVFECILSLSDLERFRRRLLKEVNEKEDNLRIYRLLEPRERYVEAYGKQPEFDLHEALVI